MTLTGATLAGSAAGNYSLGTTTSWTTTANITAKQVTGTFTAENKQYDGTTAATVLSRSVTGVLPADTENVTFTGGTATFDTAGVGTGKTVTLAGATLGGSGAGNYSLVVASTVTATANITARAITFKARRCSPHLW